MHFINKILTMISYLFGKPGNRVSEVTSVCQRKKELNHVVDKLNAWYREHNTVITGNELPYVRSVELVVNATNLVTSESINEGIGGLLGVTVERERNQDLFNWLMRKNVGDIMTFVNRNKTIEQTKALIDLVLILKYNPWYEYRDSVLYKQTIANIRKQHK